MRVIMRTFPSQTDKDAVFDAAVNAVGQLGYEVVANRTVELSDKTTNAMIEFRPEGGGRKTMAMWVTDARGSPPPIVCVERRGFGSQAKVQAVAEEIWRTMDVLLG